MKPLIRWTIGPGHKNGLQTLKHSIKNFTEIYKDEFDCVICYNGLDKDAFDFVERLKIPLFKQNANELTFEAKGVAWKLYPPRLRIDSHEVFIDNDLVITKRIPLLDKFLSCQDAVIYTDGVTRSFGRYDGHVLKGRRLNSGFFGLPPGFDFNGMLEDFMKVDTVGKWDSRLDEQGMVAAILTNHHKRYVISLYDINICADQEKFTPGIYGTHFVFVNTKPTHRAWKQYLAGIKPKHIKLL